MDKLIEIYAIQNGFLMKKKDGEYQSFQGYSNNDQRKLMLNYICKELDIKNLRVVTDIDAAKMELSK